MMTFFISDLVLLYYKSTKHIYTSKANSVL